MIKGAARHSRTPLWLDLRVLMIALIGYCVFLNVYATQSLLPLFSRVFQASKFAVSLTVSATTVGIALAAPVAGLLAEQIGRRRVMVGSVMLLTLPVLLSATAPNLKVLIAWRFVQGLVMPGIISVTMAYVSEEWAAGGAAAVMAAYVAGNVLGGVSGRFISGQVAAHFSWPTAFIVLGCVNAAGALAVWRWLPRGTQPHHKVDFLSSFREMRRQLTKPVLLSTFLIGSGMLFALVGTFTYVTFYLAAPPFGLGTAALGSLFSVYLVGVVVTPVCGQWIERLGHRRSLIIAAAAAALGDAITLPDSLTSVVCGLALCSTGVFVCQSAAASYLGHVAGRHRASAAGLYSAFYYAGGTAGAALPALAWSAGGWPACVAMLVGMLILVIVLALAFWQPSAPPPEPDPAYAMSLAGE